MGEETPPAPESEGISEKELRGWFSEEIDKALNDRGATKETFERLGKLDLLDGLEGLFEKHKGSGSVDKDSLLSEIGSLIDKKLSGGSGGSNGGGSSERQPRLRIFN